jgi:hypothetical protein
MEQHFELELTLLNKKAQVMKSSFALTIIRESMFSVSVDRLPLIEYFVLIDSPNKNERIITKVYKTTTDGRWYDKYYSEEAESNSPEFGIPEIIHEIKQAINTHEMIQVTA